MEKETRDRIADTCKEELKLRFEYLRILVFFIATIGSGTLTLALKNILDLKEQIIVSMGFIFVIAALITIVFVIKKIRYYLYELKKLEQC